MLKSKYNLQVVRVHMDNLQLMAKILKYTMIAIITGCCVQSALILTEIAKRLL
jgi:hypothetical protein